MIVVKLNSSDSGETRSEAVRALFPPAVCVAYAESTEIPPALRPEEAAAVSRAVPTRQKEFALGRWCARVALEELGAGTPTLLVGPDRGPLWPSGIVGSITHCVGFVGAAVARSTSLTSIGFDVEPATPLGQDLVSLVCRVEEIESVGSMTPLAGAGWFKVLFSAKEAIHKCISPLSGIMLDFRDVTVGLLPEAGAFSAQLRPGLANDLLPDFGRIAGRYVVTPDFVFTSATIKND
jgi:4'-phosphopantetheinyl transferase EntD